jgi:hypothetical protein
VVGPEGFEPSTNGLKVCGGQFVTVHNRSLPSVSARCLFASVRGRPRKFIYLGISLGIMPDFILRRAFAGGLNASSRDGPVNSARPERGRERTRR